MTQRYLYETHLHTSESSGCALTGAAEMARLYQAAGYTGIVITDHFINGNTAFDRRLPWNKWVDGLCTGYEAAKAEGDRIGLQVFFGWEAGYHGTEFLIFGLDKQWLLEHPEIAECTIEEQYELVHAGGGIVIHAHPFRRAPWIKEPVLVPQYVDAVEVINATHNSALSHAHVCPEWNTLATAYAKQYDLPMTSGSDQHRDYMVGGGMVFDRKIEDIHDLCRAILNREAIELSKGFAPLPD